MGIYCSCLESTRLLTTSDVLTRTITDGELTEFLANSSILGENPLSLQHKQMKKSLSTLDIGPNTSSESEWISTDLLKRKSIGQACARSQERGRGEKNRIFSSNACGESVNIIEDIKKISSHCSTNVNSRATSRCVSPIMKK